MNLTCIIEAISDVSGVKAIVLGGSQSRNESDQNSDFDLGLYYENNLDIVALNQQLQLLDDEHRENLLNPPGAWGPWINGGAWLKVDKTQVDILLRDINKVEKVIKDCISGMITIDYQCGHPFGFVNAIYAAETHYCKALWQDDSLPIGSLKSLLYSKGIFSPEMKKALIEKFLWEAGFSLACGRKAAFRGDFNYAIGSTFRTVCSWVEVLYALNNRYLMNEKTALKHVGDMEQRPDGMEPKVKAAYQMLINGQGELAYLTFETLHQEVERLVRH